MAYMQSYPNQTYLIPPKITDLFSEDHVCYLIEQIANEMDYSEFDQKYAGAGHPAYHPRINLKLLMLAHVDSMRSSRRIAKNSQENVVYIYLAEKTQPDFRTISSFRKDNPKLISQASLQLKKFAYENGLIDLSHLMIDGTSIKANANNNRILDKTTIEKLKKHIEREIQRGIQIDEEEDKIYGDRGYHHLPEDLNTSEKRRPIVRKIVDEINKAVKEDKKKIKKELEELDEHMEQEGLKKYGFTDPDSRYMRNKKNKLELGYNAQITVDKNGIIVDDDIVQCAVDKNELLPAIDRVEKDFGQLPKGTKILADAGYENGTAMEELDKKGFDQYIPGKYGAKGEFSKTNFVYDENKDIYVCPLGKELHKNGKYFRPKENRYLTIYKCGDCLNCPHQKICCKSARYRTLHAVPQDKLFQRIKKKLNGEEGRAIYKLRGKTVETAFGDIKHNKNFRSFLLRGLEKVKIEFKLVCMASNLVKINNMIKKNNVVLAEGC